MKKSYYLLFTLAIILFSCGSDDLNNNVKGKMKIGGNKHNLKSGTIENWGESEDGELYSFDITLFSNKIKFLGDELMPTEQSISAVSFELWSENASTLAEGTYLYDSEQTQDAFTLSEAEIIINYNFSTEDGIYYNINSGEIEVFKNDELYEINFEGSSIEGESISIEYKGKLTAR